MAKKFKDLNPGEDVYIFSDGKIRTAKFVECQYSFRTTEGSFDIDMNERIDMYHDNMIATDKSLFLGGLKVYYNRKLQEVVDLRMMITQFESEMEVKNE